MRKSVLTALFALAASTTGSFTPASYAQGVSSSEIVNTLAPKPLTRSFNPGKSTNSKTVSSTDRSFIQSLGGNSRAIRVEQREKLIAIVEDSELPSINLRILFAYDSARIESASFADLAEIGKALRHESLADSKIMLNGHTDAAGPRTYNQDLSERRALSVKRYLTSELSVPSYQLVVAGFGEDRLRDEHNPNSGNNRRVEIINLGE